MRVRFSSSCTSNVKMCNNINRSRRDSLATKVYNYCQSRYFSLVCAAACCTAGYTKLITVHAVPFVFVSKNIFIIRLSLTQNFLLH